MRLLPVEDSVRLMELITEGVRDAGWWIDGVGTLADARLTPERRTGSTTS